MLEAPRRQSEQTSHTESSPPSPSDSVHLVADTKNSKAAPPQRPRRERSRRSATSTRASPCCTHRPNTPRAHVLVMGDDLSNLGACPPPRLRGRARDGAATPGPDRPAPASFPRPQRAKGGIAPASTRLPGGKGRGSGPDQRRARCRRRAFRECPDRARAPRACRVAPLAPFAGARVAVLTFWGGGGKPPNRPIAAPLPVPPRPMPRPAPEADPPSPPDVPSQDLTSISLTTTERPRKRANRLTLCSLGTSTFARSSATGASP